MQILTQQARDSASLTSSLVMLMLLFYRPHSEAGLRGWKLHRGAVWVLPLGWFSYMLGARQGPFGLGYQPGTLVPALNTLHHCKLVVWRAACHLHVVALVSSEWPVNVCSGQLRLGMVRRRRGRIQGAGLGGQEACSRGMEEVAITGGSGPKAPLRGSWKADGHWPTPSASPLPRA